MRDKMLKNLDLLNCRLSEIKFDRLNPNTLKEYVSLIEFKELIEIIRESLSKEGDNVKIEIINEKINLISSALSTNTYLKKSIYKKITIYFYENRADLYVKKGFTKEVFDLVLKEAPEFESFKMYANDKEVSRKLELNFENVCDLLENTKINDCIKIKLLIGPTQKNSK
jgi:hypothetical protein